VVPARAKATTPNSSHCNARGRSRTSPPPARATKRCNCAWPSTARGARPIGGWPKSPCASVRLAEALYTHAQHGGCVLVDCMTLWLNNLLFSEHHEYPETGLVTPPEAWTAEIDALLTALPLLPGEVILVSNEIGLGVVPMGAVTRFYVDELGRLNQRLAALADNVHLLVAGIPMVVKGPAIGAAT